MRPEDVQAFLHAQPFRPFRMVMNSGSHYDIRHPEMARVTRSIVIVFYADAPSQFADRYEFVSMLLIERIEHLEAVAQG